MVVNEESKRQRCARWPPDVLDAVATYVQDHPAFYIEELRDFLVLHYPQLPNVSTATICRALNFDLNFSRKVLSKAAREAVPAEIEVFRAKLSPIYSYAEQPVFIDETAKDGRDAYRRYGWSKRNTKAVVRLPFRRGKRISVVAALDVHGFFGWDWTEGTFMRGRFHQAFIKHVVPHLNPWPLARSIVITDNAKVHAYPELEAAVHVCGARLLFLPPYCPQLNPIEQCFGLLKRWIQKNANLVFPLYPQQVLDRAMASTRRFQHCGYMGNALRDNVFDALIQDSS